MTAQPPSRTNSVLIVLMIGLMAGSISLIHRIDQQRSETKLEEVLFIPSPKVLKRMSLGYDGLLADLYWTRAVQYFGWNHKHRAKRYDLLYPLLDITTELDPHLIVAYRFGGTFLAQKPPNGAGQPERAVQLLERGIAANQGNWQLYYELGFLYAMELKDYKSAAKAFHRGAMVPGAHPFLNVLAAAMAQHGGDQQTARLLWQTAYQTTQDKLIKENALEHLRALDVDETVPKLEEVVKAYRDKAGQQPTSFLQLVAAGLLRGIPTDPLGIPYKLRPDGHVEVQDPEALPFIRQGVPPGWQPKESVPSINM